ncbi:MAG TPA: MerR family transcriptional regulator [Actinocrinis sp.]|nr:MerR family transcriptional regulator [Actinocrinis sp.]
MAGVRGLTIGEAAARLSAQYPGLTVSVLRRLEGEGVVDPERNSSGYRRYSPADLEKVRTALSGWPVPEDHTETIAATAPQVQDPLWTDPGASVTASRASQPSQARGPQMPRLPSSRTPSSRPTAVPVGARTAPSQRSGTPHTTATVATVPPPAAPGQAQPHDLSPSSLSTPASSTPTPTSPSVPTPTPAPTTPAPRRPERRWPDAEFFAPDLGEVALSRDQLAAAARTDRVWVNGLVEFGLLPEDEPVGGADLLVARASAELAQFGVEPRHLRAVAASAARVAELVTAATTAAANANRDSTRRERSALATPSRSAEAAAAAVRLHAALVRAALLRG